MPDNDLNTAIELIRQGRFKQAQPILEELVRVNPQDLKIWAWYAKSYSTPEERLRILRAGLKLNPGNDQLIDAVLKLEKQVSSKQNRNGSDTSVSLPPTRGDGTIVKRPTGLLLPDESPGSAFAAYEVWIRVLTKPTVDIYSELLRDPRASQMRSYLGIYVASLILFLTGLNNYGPIYHDGTIASVLFNQIEMAALKAGLCVLGLTAAAAIFNLVAQVFGWIGNFPRTVYLIGTWATPILFSYPILLRLLIASLGVTLLSLRYSLGNEIMASLLVSVLFLFLGIFSASPIALYVGLVVAVILQAAHRLTAIWSILAMFISVALTGLVYWIALTVLSRVVH